MMSDVMYIGCYSSIQHPLLPIRISRWPSSIQASTDSVCQAIIVCASYLAQDIIDKTFLPDHRQDMRL